MTTIYDNSSLTKLESGGSQDSYSTYQKPDTRIPPKAAPVLDAIAVNEVEIPEREILSEAQNHPAETPGRALRAAAEALVVRELLWQEAQRLNFVMPPQQDENGRLETDRDAAIRELIDREVQAPTATEEESRRYFARHPEKFRSEPLFEARHILIAAPASNVEARSAAGKLAGEICAILAEHPERFSALASEHSQCPSKEQEGCLGQLTRGSTVSEFEAALDKMEEGEISFSPVESRFGFHIIALDRRIEGRELPFEHVRTRIEAWLEASAWSRAVSQYISVLAGKAEIRGISLGGADSPLVQ